MASQKGFTNKLKKMMTPKVLKTIALVVTVIVIAVFLYMYRSQVSAEAAFHAQIAKLETEIAARAASLEDEVDTVEAQLKAVEAQYTESENESAQLENEIKLQLEELEKLQEQKEAEIEMLTQKNAEKIKAKNTEIEAAIALYENNIKLLQTNQAAELKKLSDQKKKEIQNIKQINDAEVKRLVNEKAKIASDARSAIQEKTQLYGEQIDNLNDIHDRAIEKQEEEYQLLIQKTDAASQKLATEKKAQINSLEKAHSDTINAKQAEIEQMKKDVEIDIKDLTKRKESEIRDLQQSHSSRLADAEKQYSDMVRHRDETAAKMKTEYRNNIENLRNEKDNFISELQEDVTELDEKLSIQTGKLNEMTRKRDELERQKKDMIDQINGFKERDEEVKRITNAYGCKVTTNEGIAACRKAAETKLAAEKLRASALHVAFTQLHGKQIAEVNRLRGVKSPGQQYTACPDGYRTSKNNENKYVCLAHAAASRIYCSPPINAPVKSELRLPPMPMLQWQTSHPKCNYEDKSDRVAYVPCLIMDTWKAHAERAKRLGMQLATFNTTKEFEMFIRNENSYKSKIQNEQGGHFWTGIVTTNPDFTNKTPYIKYWKHYDESTIFRDVPNPNQKLWMGFGGGAAAIAYRHPIGTSDPSQSYYHIYSDWKEPKNCPKWINDRVSAIVVLPGYEVTLYENFNGGGKKLVLKEGKYDHNKLGSMNDRMSSAIGKKVGPSMWENIKGDRVCAYNAKTKLLEPRPPNYKQFAYYKITASSKKLMEHATIQYMRSYGYRLREYAIVKPVFGVSKYTYQIIQGQRELRSTNGRYRVFIYNNSILWQDGTKATTMYRIISDEQCDTVFIHTDGSIIVYKNRSERARLKLNADSLVLGNDGKLTIPNTKHVFALLTPVDAGAAYEGVSFEYRDSRRQTTTGKNWELRSIPLECGNGGINQLKMSYVRENNKNIMRYRYACTMASGGDAGPTNTTPAVNNEGGRLNALTKLKADCGEYAISEFDITQPKTHYLNFAYKCNKKKMTQCNTIATNWDQYNDSTYYLDRHRVACNKNQAITSLQLQRAKVEGRDMMRFVYKCCAWKSDNVRNTNAGDFFG